MWDMRAIASALLPKVEVTPNHGSLILITSFHTQINDQQLEASSERFSERRLVFVQTYFERRAGSALGRRAARLACLMQMHRQSCGICRRHILLER